MARAGARHLHWVGHRARHPAQSRHRSPMVRQLLQSHQRNPRTATLLRRRPTGTRPDSLPGRAAVRGAAVRARRSTAVAGRAARTRRAGTWLMRDKLGPAVWRLGIFVVVCVLGLFALLAIFAQLRFQKEDVYQAEFTNITGLENGNFVRIAGVEVGKVKHISLKHDATVVVAFSADPSVILTEGSRAAIRYDNLIGGRYLSLEEGAGGVHQLHPGDSIPTSRTEAALDLDAGVGGLRPL